MRGKWIVTGNHLALQQDTSIYHPKAEEIYVLLSGDTDSKSVLTGCVNPAEERKDIRFSNIGSPVVIDLVSHGNGEVFLQVLASRRNTFSPVDLVDGILIDHCVRQNTWFYLSGNIAEAQAVIADTGISGNGRISIRQYIKLLELVALRDLQFVRNNVNPNDLRITNQQESAPQELKATLFPYQHTGYMWLKNMLEECTGCILGDEMGLGKTMQVIAEILHLKLEKQIPVLVVAPISLLTNWKRECAKFAPSLKTMIHFGPGRCGDYREFEKYDVIITSYTVVVKDTCMLNMIQWPLVVLDEAQNIKNPQSARTKSCKEIKRIRSLAVSGTPFENHVTDIWSLVDFIQPDLLGPLKDYKSSITDDVEGGKKIEPILSPLMLRRLVADVAKDLPEKVVSTQPLCMSEYEAGEYKKFLDELKATVTTDNINLGMLQHLRMFCAHPLTIIEGLTGDPAEISIKYQRFCEITDEIVSRDEKVIVFTSYKRMFDIFMDDVPKRFGLPVWSINGDTPVGERQEIVDRFNGLTSSAMLVLNPRAAGTGLNITGANHVIHYNLEWNPSLEDQSSARAYRRGQEKTVFIYRLYYENTVEQVVNERIERKRDIANSSIVGTDGESIDRMDLIKALEMAPLIDNKTYIYDIK